jgi:soluble lytic murein transglycosylase-like protein
MNFAHYVIASLLALITALGPTPLMQARPAESPAPVAVNAFCAVCRSAEPQQSHDSIPDLADGATETASAVAPPAAAPHTTATAMLPATMTEPLATTAPDEIASSGGSRDSAFPDSVEQWRPLVEEHFPPAWVDWALQIISCESHGDPTAVNPRTSARGLMQHLDRYWSGRAAAAGWAGASPYDPEANIAVGAWLLADGGPSHWSCRAPQP